MKCLPIGETLIVLWGVLFLSLSAALTSDVPDGSCSVIVHDSIVRVTDRSRVRYQPTLDIRTTQEINISFLKPLRFVFNCRTTSSTLRHNVAHNARTKLS